MEHREVSEKIDWPEKIGSDFIKNVIDAFPFDVHSLYGLVGIFEIAYSEEVPTAAIKLVGLPRILINYDWAVEWVHTWTDMAAVIYHEITHRMLHHLKESKILAEKHYTPNQINFLLDVRVQGLAYQVMNHPSYQVMWKRYYANAKYPISLLSNANIFDRYTVRALHKEMFSPFGVSLEKVAALVFDEEPPQGGNNSGDAGESAENQKNDGTGKNGQGSDDSIDTWQPFVGSHGETDEVQLPPGNMTDHIKEVRDIVEEKVEKATDQKEKEEAVRKLMNGGWGDSGQVENSGKQWSLADSEFLIDLDCAEDFYNADNRMKERMMKIAVETEELKAKKAVKALFPDVPDVGTRANFRDRRAVIMYLLGYWPVFFENMKEDPRGLCHVYIDDSGSQFHVIAFVVRLFAGLRDYLFPEVHFFSTKIWSAHKSTLMPGMKIMTTGGTDMNVVICHALENKITKSIVITDGYGPLNKNNAGRAKKAGHKYLIGFTEERHGDGFDAVSWKEFNLPREDES